MDLNLPGSFVHGIFQARILEWGAIAFSELSRDIYIQNMNVSSYFSSSPNSLQGSCPGQLQRDETSVQFSHSVMSNSLWPHELQYARLLCPLPTPGVYSNSHPSSWGCHPSISSSIVPFSSCPQSFPASGSFQMIQLFASGAQRSIGVSASISLLPSLYFFLSTFIKDP